MNILICDDISDDALELKNTIKASADFISENFMFEFEANCMIFFNSADALSYFNSGVKIDVCFLDILMPEMKGTELALKMRETGFKGEIVFLTSTNEYAAESYAVDAFSYLLKPPKMKSLVDIFIKIHKAQKAADIGGIPVVAGRTITRFLLFREISHVEVKRNDVFFRLLDGSEITVYAPLSEFLPKLITDRRFVQCHRSFVINMDAVTSISGREVSLRCGRKAPVSKNYIGFIKQYSNWIFGKEKRE